MTEHHDNIKTALDAASVVTVIGTLMQVLPAIAALFTIVWTSIRIWETKTIQQWWKKLRRGYKHQEEHSHKEERKISALDITDSRDD